MRGDDADDLVVQAEDSLHKKDFIGAAAAFEVAWTRRQDDILLLHRAAEAYEKADRDDAALRTRPAGESQRGLRDATQ